MKKFFTIVVVVVVGIFALYAVGTTQKQSSGTTQPAQQSQPQNTADCIQLETGTSLCGESAKNWCLNFNTGADQVTEGACEIIYSNNP